MLDSVKIKFVKHASDPANRGYRYAEIHTKVFSWIVDTADFRLIHGLSRVVSLIPEKVVSARTQFEDHLVLPGGPGVAVQLLINLLRTYRQDHELRQTGPVYRLPNLHRRCRSVVLNLEDGLDVEEDQGIDLRETYSTLIINLVEVESTTEAADAAIYWDAAYDVVELADRVRELCFIYLELVHPFMRHARRGIDEHQYLRLHGASIRLRLERSAGVLMQEFLEVKPEEDN